MKRMCKICGQEFYTLKNELYCSAECRREQKRRQQRDYHAAQRKTSVKVKCAHCGKVFEAKGKQIYCSDKCRDAAYTYRLNAERKKPEIAVKCKQCGKEFKPRHLNELFCSDECRKVAKREEYRRLNGYINARKVNSNAPRKMLDEWCREAAECNLDYGTYRALIELGKTFEELKARAESRRMAHHSHCRAGRKA